jgi:hypothetical protein
VVWAEKPLHDLATVQESTENLPPHVVMTSLAYKTKWREKVIFFKVPVFLDNEGSA